MRVPNLHNYNNILLIVVRTVLRTIKNGNNNLLNVLNGFEINIFSARQSLYVYGYRCVQVYTILYAILHIYIYNYYYVILYIIYNY